MCRVLLLTGAPRADLDGGPIQGVGGGPRVHGGGGPTPGIEAAAADLGQHLHYCPLDQNSLTFIFSADRCAPLLVRQAAEQLQF